MSTFTLTKTQRNKPLLICKGFTYNIDKTGDEKTYWKCEYARNIKCKGRIHTNNSYTEILHENDIHNHPGNAVANEIRLFEEKIHDRAINCHESTQTIINKCISDLSDNAVARLSAFKHIKRNIQHYRTQTDLPTIPHDKSFVNIPDLLSLTQRSDQFLQYDSGPGNDRIIIFSSNDQLRLIETFQDFLVDGTFKVSPEIFYQLYCIHVLYRDVVIPVLFALLPNKTQETYQRLINKLIEICPSFNPQSIMMDFEKASINVFNQTFATGNPSFKMSGCFFHLQNNLQKKLQKFGLKTNYEQDPLFAHSVNQIAALAFLVPADVGQGIEELYESLPLLLHPLLNYFEDTYVGRLRAQRRSKPMFEIEFWNMNQRTSKLAMRTNNSVESWHRRLSSVIQCNHHTLWTFINYLKTEEHYIHCQLVKINAGEKTQPNKKYLNYTLRLQQLVLNLHSAIKQQLEGLAHNLYFSV